MRSHKSLFILLLVIFSGGLIFLPSCQEGEHVTVLKLAHGLDQSHSVHKGMVFMAERVKEKSGGKMRLEIYPSGQLGSERENVEMLQIGSLAITKVSAAIMEGFAPSYRIFGLPYIFTERTHAHRVLDSDIGREILLDGEEFWLRGLAFYDAGSRSFYTKDRPINHPDDLRGLKIRVMQSPMAVNMIRAFGGSPTPISWGELYTALQGGVVDGAENNPPSFYLSHHYEVCRYYSLNEHSTIPDVLLISTKIWNTLTEQEQQWLQEAADESAIYQRKLWEESEIESLRLAEEAGITIIYPDKAPFIERVQSIYENFRQDENLYSLIKRIQAMQEEPLQEEL
ncbi:MAG: TRAP transporter substrate-binding protein [Bacteroidales bacterium]|nr:TRAP transporter substrate-binding protein [Bacteroidales bacterium]